MSFGEIREEFRAKIQDSGVRIDLRWGKRCLGHNVYAPLTPEAQQQFHAVQNRIRALAPDSLYTCAPETMHITAAWVLGTPQEYSRPKAVLWEEIRDACITGLQQVSNRFSPFVVHYQEVIATDTAIIAVATDDGSLNRLRHAITEALPIPEETPPQSRIIHTTLFRYRAPLPDAERFLDALSVIRLAIAVPVTELLVRKETIYPCLEIETESVLFLSPPAPLIRMKEGRSEG